MLPRDDPGSPWVRLPALIQIGGDAHSGAWRRLDRFIRDQLLTLPPLDLVGVAPEQ
jgi:hypothetical protein